MTLSSSQFPIITDELSMWKRCAPYRFMSAEWSAADFSNGWFEAHGWQRHETKVARTALIMALSETTLIKRISSEGGSWWQIRAFAAAYDVSARSFWSPARRSNRRQISRNTYMWAGRVRLKQVRELKLERNGCRPDKRYGAPIVATCKGTLGFLSQFHEIQFILALHRKLFIVVCNSWCLQPRLSRSLDLRGVVPTNDLTFLLRTDVIGARDGVASTPASAIHPDLALSSDSFFTQRNQRCIPYGAPSESTRGRFK
ncbi:hypothetical protein NM688_g8596 [Phlebia brevispora]|uniref:Uncharacterized protein n=1 Tax=Phlebia brevispora TaxID=194682 RepID=A0ACC1RSH2_9APHY|nr:hypothetical protein NM688_g8596 [Phlebia brevispora]